MPTRRDYYIDQLESGSGQGARECFSSTGAMLASTYRGQQIGLDEYNKIRSRYGDSTNVSAQLGALKELGLNASVADNGSIEELRQLVKAGKPVGIGVNHNGRGGHWLTVHGVTEGGDFVVDDPYGRLKQQKFGGWEAVNSKDGKAGNNAVYGAKFLESIFEDRGKGTGRILRVNGKADGGLAEGGSGASVPGAAQPSAVQPSVVQPMAVQPLAVQPLNANGASASAGAGDSAGVMVSPGFNGLRGLQSGKPRMAGSPAVESMMRQLGEPAEGSPFQWNSGSNAMSDAPLPNRPKASGAHGGAAPGGGALGALRTTLAGWLA